MTIRDIIASARLTQDRSMTREEYRHWRHLARNCRHNGPVWFNMADPTPTKAVSDAAYAQLARRMAIELRVYRNKARLGLWR